MKKKLDGLPYIFFLNTHFFVLIFSVEALLNLWVSTLRSKKVPTWPASTDTSKETTPEKAQAS